MRITRTTKLGLFGIGFTMISFLGSAQTWEIYDQNIQLKSRLLNEDINFLSEQIRIGQTNNQVNLLSKEFRPFLNLKGHSINQIIEPWIIVESKQGFGAFHEYGEEIFALEYDEIQTFYTRLLAKKGNKYWVYDRMNRTNHMIGEFENATLAQNGQVIAKGPQGYFLPISANPDRIYKEIKEVNENFIISKEESGYGLINREGRYVLDPIIDHMVHLEDDYFYAFDGNQYMLIKGREEKVDINYTSYHKITLENNILLEYIHGKLRRVMKNDGILLDMTGMEAVKPIGKNWYNIYTREKKVGLLGNSGWEVNPIAGVDAILPGTENLYPAIKDGKLGYINKSGSWVIENIFEEARQFSNGMAAVKLNGQWTYINSKGNFNLQNTYEDAKDFHRGLAIVKKDGKSKLINTNGAIITEHGYDKISLLPDNYYLTEIKGDFGLINPNGKEILFPQYELLRRESTDIILARKDGKYGILDEDGNFRLPIHYHQILFDPSSKSILAKDNTPILPIEIDAKSNKKRKAD
jgi:hypothetical protein